MAAPGLSGAPLASAIFGDPAVRADGLCVVCDKPRHPERSAKYAKGIAELDPFCSNVCARDWYANPIPDFSIWGLTPTTLDAAA